MSCPDPVQIDSPVFGGHDVALEWVRKWIGKANQTETCKTSDLFWDMSWDNPILKYKGCLAFMGDTRWYKDPGSRVYVWVIPILFLLFNVSVGPADKVKLFAIVHALGDPLDTIWSLLDKLHAWYRCYDEAEAFVEKCRVWRAPGKQQQKDVDGLEKRGSSYGGEGDTTAGDSGGQDVTPNQIGAVVVATMDAIAPADAPNKDKSQPKVSVEGAEPRGDQEPDDGPVLHDPNLENSIRILASVFAGFEELVGHHPDCEKIYYEAAEELKACDVTALQAGHDSNNFVNIEWRRAALNLTDHRTNEFVRTFFALLVYLLAVFAEFIDQIASDGEATPGGRIGAAMCLTWLISATLLSNLLGSFSSRRTCLETVMRLIEEINKLEHPEEGQDAVLLSNLPGSFSSWRTWFETRMRLVREINKLEHPEEGQDATRSPVPSSWNEYFDSLPFTGSNYSFRPFKVRNIRRAVGSERRTRLLLPFLALIPLALAFIPAMVIHHYAVPEGFGCRNFWIIGLFATWIISLLLTHLLQALADWKETPRWRAFFFWLTYAKDLAIGVSAVVMVFLSVAGIFSNCWCWSRVLFLGEENAYLPLAYRPIYLYNKKTRFPALVAVFQGFQILYVMVIARSWQRGRKLALWGETLKREMWRQIHDGGRNEPRRGLRRQRKDRTN